MATQQKRLVYLVASAVSSNVSYDGGSNVNAHVLEYAARTRDIRVMGLGDNLSKKVMLRRVPIPFDPFETVREHQDEPIFSGTLLNLLSMLRSRGFRSLRREEIDYVMSGADFWPETIPAWLLKRAHPETVWIACCYLFAPKPWQKDNPYRTSLGGWVIGLMYWLTQIPAYRLIRRYADYVLVTSEPDVEKFVTRKRGRDRVIVAQGGVDVAESEAYLRGGQVIPFEQRKYDACFVGRFHYQKGVLELVDIWQEVLKTRPAARLAMIGAGALEDAVRARVKERGLQNSIDLLGFKDGAEKEDVFKQSRIVVHPATYDSGGMAAAEAMAWKLPGVSFDLEALKTYYPKGMLKTEPGNLGAFANNVLALLEDGALYRKTAEEAYQLIHEKWVWDARLRHICATLFGEQESSNRERG